MDTNDDALPITVSDAEVDAFDHAYNHAVADAVVETGDDEALAQAWREAQRAGIAAALAVRAVGLDTLPET